MCIFYALSQCVLRLTSIFNITRWTVTLSELYKTPQRYSIVKLIPTHVSKVLSVKLFSHEDSSTYRELTGYICYFTFGPCSHQLSLLYYAKHVPLSAPHHVIDKLKSIQNTMVRIIIWIANMIDSVIRICLSPKKIKMKNKNTSAKQNLPMLRLFFDSFISSSLAIGRRHNAFQGRRHSMKSIYTIYQLPSILCFTWSLFCLRSSDQLYLFPTPSNVDFGSRSIRCSSPVIWLHLESNASSRDPLLTNHRPI